MQAYISASSPLFTYRTCRSCDASSAFQSGSVFSGRDYNGSDSGMITRMSGSTVSLTCTGTGVSFDVTYSQPQNTSFTASLTVNGSTPLSTYNSTSTSIRNLPLGQHNVELTFNTTSTQSQSPSQDDWLRVNGANCTLGSLTGKETKNQIIDDTAWRDWKIALTPGWNMLEKDMSNYINEEQYLAEVDSSTKNYNGSISWTEEANALDQIEFQGSAIWLYGIVGGEAGSYQVTLDDISQGTFNASGGPRVYNSILYHTSNLADGNHTISLVNIEQGKRLSFDRLVAMSGLVAIQAQAGLSSTSPSSSEQQPISHVEVSSVYPTSSSSQQAQLPEMPSSLNGGAIAGIAIAGSLVMLAFMSAWIFACLRRRKEKQHNEKEMAEKPDVTFMRFSSIPSQPLSTHPFHPIPEVKATPKFNFNFSSPTPSLRSFINSHVPSEDRATSFLKLAGRRTSKPLVEQGTVSKTKKLNIGNPQHLRDPNSITSTDYVPSLSSGAEHIKPLNPNRIKGNLNPDNRKLAPHSDANKPLDRPESSSSRSNTISPLVAALSGMTSSPLAELSRKTSTKGTQALNGYFGRRKGSISNSMDTRRDRPDSTRTTITEKSEGDNGGDNGILSMYAAFPPGSQSNTTCPAEGEGQFVSGDGESKVGVALGSPMQDNMFDWEGGQNQNLSKKQFDEELRPPTRRFFGFGDRPKSGVSNKSGKTASSVGSGWRYM
ncbi:uncharacterized protein IL334_007657 [Kwoniella shivajii]|uniref:Uncharacterized protein n=1 Tax=Kwoniella shivajii TaxID=564305 RepID=A0ABZ1D9A4_9TREE|nr:hypothetical protein IL334_007657 [Kwoniella shivajii]